MANFTKKAIIDTLMELLDQMPLSQITVKKIVDTCEINHNTFYYYFCDVYAVLDEIFEDELRKLQEITFSSGSLGDTCTYALDFINTHRRMILHIYNSVSRDKLERHLMKVIDKVMNDFSDQFLKDPGVSDDDRQFFIGYLKCAMLGFILTQFEKGKENDLEMTLRRFGALTEQNVRDYLKSSAEALSTCRAEKSEPPENV